MPWKKYFIKKIKQDEKTGNKVAVVYKNGAVAKQLRKSLPARREDFLTGRAFIKLAAL